MTTLDDMQTPPHVKGPNKANQTDVGVKVTPPTVRSSGATNVQNNEERSANSEAQPTMHAEATAGNKLGRTVDGDNLTKAATEKTVASPRKIKEKNIAAKTKQSTISFFSGLQLRKHQRDAQTKQRPGT